MSQSWAWPADSSLSILPLCAESYVCPAQFTTKVCTFKGLNIWVMAWEDSFKEISLKRGGSKKAGGWRRLHPLQHLHLASRKADSERLKSQGGGGLLKVHWSGHIQGHFIKWTIRVPVSSHLLALPGVVPSSPSHAARSLCSPNSNSQSKW